ncbi:tyrosine--tRNA ligase [Flavipsychrobacter stenotrophus]|uniref:Tyrosine--tRNA ligase n=1 Tax=Flavipsychrobacter stenotrophus TaxID=2077091 RepID=A0A2S7SWU6_9BACT|nr:tyrosine--tRNA ligase [Flavipsychrobacter stenotrophus]PQJ11402.1 tyrosine--tRNA ligase [Flavipsychrobacter stenotrophus]
MNLIAELRERGLLHDVMPGTEEQLNKEMTSGYIGFDPTADSLHIGSMLQITLLMRLQKAGHKPYALIGGATGMIGDPSGKSAERNLLDAETIEKNCAGQRKQLEKFLDFNSDAPNAAVMVNNYDWFKNFSFLDFIRDVGKNITVNYMMSKDSVQKRLETGLSFTEFTYQLIQGYDFFHLNTHHNVKLQMGGSDQWGNIVTGTELIRRKGGGDAFALVSPLITKSDGSKFGKSEGGNIWLDPERTSPYKFYQFWLNLPDVDAAKMLLIYSFKPLEELHSIIAEHNNAYGARIAQKALADEITTLVHSADDLAFAKQASDILFGKSSIDTLRALNENQLMEVLDGVAQINGAKAPLTEGLDIISFLADNAILPSRGEAKKMLQANGISINKEKVPMDFVIREEHLLHGKYLLVLKGKKEYTLAIFN